MVFENGTAFLLAFALLKALPGHRVHQVIVFLPVVLSAVIVGFLWKLFLHPLFGLVNQALALVDIQGRAWLGDESTALGSIVLAHIWHWLGFPTLVLLAGMQRISKEVLATARLAGAGDMTLLRKIIWPLIAPSVTIICILTFIGSFNWFELPYIMAGLTGSPGGSTDVLGLYFYRTAFGSTTTGIQDFGQGSALAVLMFVFIAGVTALALRFLRRPRSSCEELRQFLKNGAIQGVLLLNAFIMVYPLFVMVISSFKTNAEIFTSPFALPHSFSLANAEKVWTDTNFVRYLANSIGVTAPRSS
jgi:raffinose/stachyose/melibiose transport system permease protein